MSLIVSQFGVWDDLDALQIINCCLMINLHRALLSFVCELDLSRISDPVFENED